MIFKKKKKTSASFGTHNTEWQIIGAAWAIRCITPKRLSDHKLATDTGCHKKSWQPEGTDWVNPANIASMQNVGLQKNKTPGIWLNQIKTKKFREEAEMKSDKSPWNCKICKSVHYFISCFAKWMLTSLTM